MKRLVIINFDDMFVNVSKIICNILNSLEEVKKRNILIREYQLGCDLEKPFLTLFYEMLEDYDISVDQETLSTLELDFKNNLIKNAVLADGLQNFLNEAKERNVEVRVITNKSYDEVVNCVKHFTFDLVTGVDSYKESPQAIKLIEKIQNILPDIEVIMATYGDIDFPRYLYDHNCRIIPDGAVVLTKEEYSDYLLLKNDYKHASEKLKELQGDNERLYRNLGKFKDSVRKETAREILKELITNCQYTFNSVGKPIIALNGDFALNVSKRYDVDIEE